MHIYHTFISHIFPALNYVCEIDVYNSFFTLALFFKNGVGGITTEYIIELHLTAY